MIYKKDFMCACSPEQEQKCKDCLERVYKDLDAEPHTLLSRVVYGLEWGLEEDYNGMINEMMCDQWAAVGGEVHYKNEKIGGLYVQCDLLEHGVARLFELASEIVKEHMSGIR